MKTPLYQIVAVDKKYGMGKDGKIPWKLAKEMDYFKNKTIRTENGARINMLIMGRKTWESIPETNRPLPARKNVIMTRNKDYKAEGATVVHNLKDALAEADDTIESVYIIGGAKIFDDTIRLKELDGIYLTVINNQYSCDTRFPRIPKHFKKKRSMGKDEEDGVKFEYLLITRK